MPNGQVLNASFIRQHTHNLYQVRSNATFKHRRAEISLHILRANVYEAMNSFKWSVMVLASALKSAALFMLPSSSTLFQTRYYSSVFNCLATLYLENSNRGCLSAMRKAWLPIQVTAFPRFVAGAWWGIYGANAYVECLQSETRRAEDDYSLRLVSRRRPSWRSLRCKAIARQGVTHFTFCEDTCA